MKSEFPAFSGRTERGQNLRLWPGVIIVSIQWLLRYLLPVISPDPTTTMVGVAAGFLGFLAVIAWWAFFSRTGRSDRWIAVLVMISGLIVTSQIVDDTIRTGNMGLMFFLYAPPILSLAFVAWAVISRWQRQPVRRISMIAVILAACFSWLLFRSDGIRGGVDADFSWRWSRTPEERFLVSRQDPGARNTMAYLRDEPAEWPGFRGPERNSVIGGLQIGTNWSEHPPVKIWRRPVGPGCSSFAIRGDLFFTQEQHGDKEVVTCYRLSTGEPVWVHGDDARFWDSHAGAGPRSTPTLSGDMVYTLGATGIVNVLDARNGKRIWSRNAAEDSGVELPGWGFSGSPLVYQDMLFISVGGTLVAYDLTSGDIRWIGINGGKGYSSPHLLTIEGNDQVLLMCEAGVTAFSPADGKELWKNEWPEERIVQPAQISGGELLISAGGLKGIRRLSVARDGKGWKAEEKWTSIRLRPNHNDFVIHQGFAFGFDGNSLGCIDIIDGERQWKGGRYGGQMLLLADQELLLILTEKGELALAEANPDHLRELARIPAIEGKTWNHPALAGDLLLVRNGQEMAAFRLPPA